jgi:hypothetical protein
MKLETDINTTRTFNKSNWIYKTVIGENKDTSRYINKMFIRNR